MKGRQGSIRVWEPGVLVTLRLALMSLTQVKARRDQVERHKKTARPLS